MGYHTTSTALQDVVPQLTGLSAGLPDAPATIGPSPAPAGRPLEPPLPAPAAAPGRPKGAPAAPVVISPPPPETPLPEVPAAPPLEVFPALPLAPASHRTTPRHGDKPRPRKRKEALPSTATGPSGTHAATLPGAAARASRAQPPSEPGANAIAFVPCARADNQHIGGRTGCPDWRPAGRAWPWVLRYSSANVCVPCASCATCAPPRCDALAIRTCPSIDSRLSP